MRLRERGFLRRDYNFDDLGRAIVVALFIIGVGAFVLWIVYSSIHNSGDDEADVRAQLQTLINEAPAEERRAIADSILTLYAADATSWVETGSDTEAQREDILAQLERVASIGHAIALDTHIVGWSVFMEDWFFWTLLGAICVLCGAVFIWYVMASSNKGHFIADLRWKNPGVWLFVSVTLLPFGWVAYPISIFRLRAFRRNQPAPLYYDHDADRYVPVVQIVPFNSEPEEAKNWYVAYRLGAQQRHRDARIETLNREISGFEDEIEQLGDQLDECQRQRHASKRQLKELEAMPLPSAEVTQRVALDEFEAIMRLHNVAGIRVTDEGGLSLKVDVRVPYKQQLYDFGDWEVTLEDGYLESQLLRSAVQPGYKGRYPDYDYGGGTFCFGNAQYQITDLLREGKILEAANLTVGTLHTVNPGDVSNIPRVFKVVEA